MSKDEYLLIGLLGLVKRREACAILLQNFIAEFGPLSDEAAKKARAIIKQKDGARARPSLSHLSEAGPRFQGSHYS